jgi:hypothetical protein
MSMKSLKTAVLAATLALTAGAAAAPASATIVEPWYEDHSNSTCVGKVVCNVIFQAIPDKRAVAFSNISCHIETAPTAKIIFARLISTPVTNETDFVPVATATTSTTRFFIANAPSTRIVTYPYKPVISVGLTAGKFKNVACTLGGAIQFVQ